MEELKDFVSELKARLGSPLIGSYIIAWLIFNWQIPIFLFFYKQTELGLDDYKSYRDVILQNIDVWRNLIWPLGIALFYILCFPYVKAWIKVYQFKILTKSENEIYEITYTAKTYTFKIDELNKEHAKTKDQLEAQRQELVKALAANSVLDQEKENLKAFKEDAIKLNQLNDVSRLKGNWRVEFSNKNGGVKEIWTIKSWIVYVDALEQYRIHNVIVFNNRLWLHFSAFGNDQVSYLFILDMTNGLDNMDGKDLNQKPVKFMSRSVDN
jgi:hypothetical protein